MNEIYISAIVIAGLGGKTVSIKYQGKIIV